MPWMIPAAMIGGSLISAAGSAYSANKMSDNEEPEPYFQQLPDYPEAEGARGAWWGKLQEWGADPNYGGISPDWEDIWNKAKMKISQYYWGSPTSSGLAGKIRASAARRGVSESPAMENQLTRMGVEEANQLGGMTTEQNTQRAQLGENARMNWLNSITNLASQKPQYMTNWGVSSGGSAPIAGSIMGALGTGLSTYAQNKSSQDFYTQLFDKMRKDNRVGEYTPSSMVAWGGKSSPVTGYDPGVRVDPSLYS